MNHPHSAAVLFTINLQPVARFYERVIGMQILRTEPDHIGLQKNGFRLTVHQIPAEHSASIRIAVPPEIRETSALKLSLPVANIASARQIAAQLGGCVHGADHEWDYEGAIMCDGWDPDGNVFQLFQPR